MSKINFTVTYDRYDRACQVNVLREEITEKIEYVKGNNSTEPLIVEMGAL